MSTSGIQKSLMTLKMLKHKHLEQQLTVVGLFQLQVQMIKVIYGGSQQYHLLALGHLQL